MRDSCLTGGGVEERFAREARRAWTEPGALGWFCNPGMETEVPVKVDLRVGGQWRLHMVENAAREYFTGGLYREIVPGRKLVFNWGAVGGWPELDVERPDDSPLVTLRFMPKGAQETEMELHLQLPDHFTAENTEWWMNCGMVQGWGMTIDRLVGEFRKVLAQ